MRKLIHTFIIGFTLIGASLAFADHHVVASGAFVGKSDHKTSGAASIEQLSDGGYVVVLGDNFSLDGAPDPKVALGNNGYDKSTLLGKLEKKNGKQIYRLPANIDPTNYNEIWIWCEKFSVPLGVAKLK